MTDLHSAEAIEKLKKLAEDSDICMFVTKLTEFPLSSRPMSTQKVDDEGNIWFMSGKDSDKNMHIAEDKRVHIFYQNKGNSEYLSVYGNAEISTDREKIKEMWTPIAKAWFEEGVDDPDITLIKVVPENAHYWDTKNNKMISFAKILVSMLTGKGNDDGVEGELDVN